MDIGSLNVPLQGLFVLVLAVFLLNWIGPKVSKIISKWRNAGYPNSDLDYAHVVKKYSSEQKTLVEKWQRDQDEKTKGYTERIIIPREEEKLRKRIETLYRFSGPAWKGKGEALGGDSSQCEELGGDTLSPGQTAAQRRTVQENINQNVVAKLAREKHKKNVQKKIIELPEEPEETDTSAVTIIFRAPTGQSYQRRFSSKHNMQNIFDYITSKGFSQTNYCVATSYPRVLLDDPSILLSSLEQGRRYVLNIEGRD